MDDSAISAISALCFPMINAPFLTTFPISNLPGGGGEKEAIVHHRRVDHGICLDGTGRERREMFGQCDGENCEN